MSANACIAFFGIRFDVPAESVDHLLEHESDPRIKAADAAKLDVYWANFGGAAERYQLLIGKRIGMLGPENSLEMVMSLNELNAIASTVSYKLGMAKLGADPVLFFLWEEDN